MCEHKDCQPKRSDIVDHRELPKTLYEQPLLSRVESKFVECGDCICWKKLPKDDTPKCRRHAPRPVINSSLMDTRQTVVWPLTALTDGCFEGNEKGPALEEKEEYTIYSRKGEEKFKPPLINFQKFEDEAEKSNKFRGII